MHDPVVLVQTGQTYDRLSITQWLAEGNDTCPLTGVMEMGGYSQSLIVEEPYNMCTLHHMLEPSFISRQVYRASHAITPSLADRCIVHHML
jgi:U-box domain